MRFIVDECTGPNVSTWLRNNGHDVYCVFEQARGISDAEVLTIAIDQNRVIITNDKDFGVKAFKEHHVHSGIILLRLQDERSQIKIAVLSNVLKNHQEILSRSFIVATEQHLRIAGNG